MSRQATSGRTSCSGRCARWSRWPSSGCASGCCASRASSASPSRRPAGTAASTAWVCWRSACSPFPTYFQCKRYSDSVGAGAVRDFRGAMTGRGEKGLIITTATFTSAAQAEATRDGVPPIDLIDGDRLCDLLKQVGLGVSVEMVERITVDVAALADGTAT
jgi:hypothetical protein